MEFDPEVNAMQSIFTVLKELKEDAQKRVVNWVVDKLGLGGGKKRLEFWGLGDDSGDMNEKGIQFNSFESLADLFAKASLPKIPDKVLVAAAFLQKKSGDSELTGRQINKELHHLGHGVGNITLAIGRLINRKPQLMIQTRKEGKTRQAQKKYKVTIEGFAAAKKILNPPNAEQS